MAPGLGPAKGLEYLTGYVVEKARSVDNIFVFILVFATFGVAPSDRRKVLLWGILGAIAMLGAFIVLGAALLERFHWVIYGFGFLLVWPAWHAAHGPGTHAMDPVANLLARWLPIAPGPYEVSFFRAATLYNAHCTTCHGRPGSAAGPYRGPVLRRCRPRLSSR